MAQRRSVVRREIREGEIREIDGLGHRERLQAYWECSEVVKVVQRKRRVAVLPGYLLCSKENVLFTADFIVVPQQEDLQLFENILRTYIYARCRIRVHIGS